MTQTEIKDKVIQGGKLAIERLLDRKRKDNSYVVISEKGKVIRRNARELER